VNESTLEQTKAEVAAAYPKVSLLAQAGNVADDGFAESFIQRVVQTYGRVDYGVNCAGVIGIPARSSETSLAEFDRVNNINYRGCWLSSRAQLKQMVAQNPLPSHDPSRLPQRGAVVNIASQLGIVSRPNARMFFWLCYYSDSNNALRSAAYCASKSAIIGLTRADAIDYSKDGIRVNCVCPGVIETPLIMEKKEVRDSIMPAVEIAPMKRMGTPAEVADVVLFLCSTRASFVQGHAMVVDGGYITV
jgi:NAD(P)-dependent dehydrogenase (short-subunit alcohol dehydrogenase family)